jgi:hypothetical protein
MAGRRELRRAAPLIRTLQRAAHVGSTSASVVLGPREGEIHPLSYGEYSLRQVAQLSLRRLGERASGDPATFFRYYSPGEAGRKFVPRGRPEPRALGASRIEKHMTPLEVLETLGPPDFVVASQGAWEYDIDGTGQENPYTLRVVWDERRVSSVERITPPLWAAGDRRDVGLPLLAGGPVTPAQIGITYAPAPAESWSWLALAAAGLAAILGTIAIALVRRRRARA